MKIIAYINRNERVHGQIHRVAVRAIKVANLPALPGTRASARIFQELAGEDAGAPMTLQLLWRAP